MNRNFRVNFNAPCMKRSQVILFSVFLVISSLIYIPIALNKKEYNKSMKEESKTVFLPVDTVQNSLHTITLTSYGQVSPITELMVSFEVQGKLIEGKQRLKPGVKFKKGTILYKIDRQELAFTIAARKTSLAGMVAQSMPDIALDYPSQVKKWETFMFNLSPNKLLPELPEFANPKERLFWTTRNMLTEYYNILSLENRMEKYDYFAPFSGTVIEVYSEPGSIVNPGVQIAKIARTGEFELKVPVALEDLAHYEAQKVAAFTNSDGKLIGNGTILRVSDVVNQRTQSADVYYSVKPVNDAKVYNGMFLNVTIDRKVEKNIMPLPRTAVKKGQTGSDIVFILKENKVFAKEIKVVASIPDTTYVQGLSDGQKVVLEEFGKPSKDITYKGISR